MKWMPPPNSCQVPNGFFDVLLPQLGDAELRVMLYLIRQSFGWQREWTERGYGRIEQICKGGGLSRQGAINALKALRERGAIESRKVGIAFEYRVCVHDVDSSTDQAEPVNVVDRPDVQSTTLTEVSQAGGPTSVNEVDRESVNVVDRIKTQGSKPTENPNEGAAAAPSLEEDDRLRSINAVLVEARGTPWAKLTEAQQCECVEAARELADCFTIEEIRFGAHAWWTWAREAFRREPTAPTFGQLRKHIEAQAPRRRPAGPLFGDDFPPSPLPSLAPPLSPTARAAEWPEPDLAPVLEALGYTPATCPPGERLSADRLVRSASRACLPIAYVVKAAERVGARSSAADKRRVAELQLELDAMAVRP